MARPVVLYLAISLDGYLAGPDGEVDWLAGEDPHYPGDLGYDDFFRQVDTILMGRTTYDQLVSQLSPDRWPYPGRTTIVFTHRPLPGSRELQFTAESPAAVVERLRREAGEVIWICGGASLAGQLARAGLIDRYQLTILPCLQGEGIPLFSGQFPPSLLHLEACRQENGVLLCTYSPRQ